MDVKGDTCIRF